MPDFNIKDLTFPDSTRTCGILCAIANFIKFNEQCEVFISELRDGSAALVKEREIVAMELAEVRRKNAALRYLQVVAILIAYPTLLQGKASRGQTYV